MNAAAQSIVSPLTIVATSITHPNGFDVAVKSSPLPVIEISDSIFDDASCAPANVTVEIVDVDEDLIVTVGGEDANLLDLPSAAQAIVSHVSAHRAIYNSLLLDLLAPAPMALVPSSARVPLLAAA